MFPLKQSYCHCSMPEGHESGQTYKEFKSHNSGAKFLKLRFCIYLAVKENVSIAL